MEYTIGDKKNEFEKRYSANNERINILMENFQFFHRTNSENINDPKYICPLGGYEQFSNWLKFNKARSASYLITGYRGAGKTGFVHYVINDLNKRKEINKKFVPISISLGQEILDEIELLRIIARKLFEEVKKPYLFTICNYCQIVACIMIIIQGVLFLSSSYFKEIKNFTKEIMTDELCILIGVFVIYSIFLFSLVLRFFYSKKYAVLERIEKLCVSLSSAVTNEKGLEMSSKISKWIEKFGFSIKKNIYTPPASVQEIEYELIEIFQSLNEIDGEKHYVIIFDELDKIDPTESSTTDGGEYKTKPVYSDRTDHSQGRRQQVLSIIANMKFFLSNAQAYFIFIAGREMYEAFQADMSDRDFSINSIFHGVLNIDSFLSSSREINNVTVKTEEFLCRQLLPLNFDKRENSFNYAYISKPYTLKNYYKYRLEECFDFSGFDSFEEYRQYVWRDVWFLYHFISYLSFISNGSPKKMSLFLEKYIRTGAYIDANKDIGNHRLMTAHKGGDKSSMFYLSFGYYSMLKINFIHHLTYPIIQNQVNRANMFGDKLLVAASFMISHLFKLHNNGFSWRNIEQMPELQEIDRTPEVREYISSMIDFMNHSYLTTIPYGLFHYKFPMRICEEISFLSKLSGEASALFNFTSGELQPAKKHYETLLEHCAKQSSEIGSEYTKASTHHSLGDLYAFEENFSAAIHEYEQALELIPSPSQLAKNRWIEKNYLLFVTRTMLKLGLAHEKRHTDNSAYIIYNELITLLKTCRNYSWAKLLFKDTRTMHLALLAKIYTLEKLDTEGVTKFHIKEICKDFNMLFQNAGKLVKADFYRKLGDILYYKNLKSQSGIFDKYPYTAIACYKSSLLSLLGEQGKLRMYEPNSSEFCIEVCNQVFKAKEHLLKNKDHSQRDYYIYQLALTCESLGHVLVYNANKPLTQTKTISIFNSFCSNFNLILLTSNDSKTISSKNSPQNHLECSMYYYYIAAVLYNLSCERGLSANCYKEILQIFITYFGEIRKDTNISEQLVNDIIKLLDNLFREELIALHRQKEYIYLSEENGIKWLKGLEMYEEIDGYDLSLMPEAEDFFYLYYSVLIELWEVTRSRTLLIKIASFYNAPLMSGKRSSQTLLNIISNLQLKGKYNLAPLKVLVSFDIESTSLCSPQKINNFLENGINIDFNLAEDLLHFFPSNSVTLFCNQNISKPTEDILEKRMDLLDFLVTDTLFCFTRITELLTPLRNTTLFTNSYKAAAFDRLQRICHLYKSLYCYYRFGENKYKDASIRKDKEVDFGGWSEAFKWINTNGRGKALFERAAKLTRKSTPSNTHIRYLSESAIHYYTRARQVHTEGKTYQEMIRSLYFLEDDLNNDTLQFYLAIERYSFNKGNIREKEYELKEQFKTNEIYKLDWYFKT